MKKKRLVQKVAFWGFISIKLNTICKTMVLYCLATFHIKYEWYTYRHDNFLKYVLDCLEKTKYTCNVWQKRYGFLDQFWTNLINVQPLIKDSDLQNI